ncbi:hypothetical protein LRP49_03265 [Enterovibrio sp. ZSDZ35]|uniref:FIST domain-containing protein n=1 Tax=Enterovibrio qingdaonensis TaxID=2899818 RepID=A0ABT5QGV0_9GAMM|nr:hypothetical protein [Enterovibrio sp. ZSDZ35]MDD1780212.1 hypothetical protein [Enterovibrio sp. ZSDZ35]
MFEPILEDDDIRIGVSAPSMIGEDIDLFIPFDALSASSISEKKLDLLFLCGVTPEQAKPVINATDLGNCVIAYVESTTHNIDAIWHAVRSIKGKLDSKEMPNNIDVTDIRTLLNNSHHLFAFDNKAALVDFVWGNQIGDATGVIYLAHGDIDLEDYGKVNKEISDVLPPYAVFTSSIFFAGNDACSALVGVKNSVLD